jgi:hypothetical protein
LHHTAISASGHERRFSDIESTSGFTPKPVKSHLVHRSAH